MSLLQRVSDRLGALPARKFSWGLVIAFSVWVLFDILVLRVSHGVTLSNYDAMVRARFFSEEMDPRIVIIDIDEASLARMGKEFGRWPWPRDTLAAVLDFVEKQQPQAIAWDIVFSDADRLSPGGDAAFNEAVKQSQHSHFSVVRLPKTNDASSQVDRHHLGGLWATEGNATASGVSASTVAMVAPALPAVAASRLGYNNGYVDADGILRRYRYFETLSDDSLIHSLPMSVLRAVDPSAYLARVQLAMDASRDKEELIAWRKRADAYPRVPFADVFAVADGSDPAGPVPSFAGKIIIIGSTAPSLHDIHPTPLSSMHGGVDALATALDNALNERQLREMPRSIQAALAIALCAGLAVWVQFRGGASLAPALWFLPAALLGIGYFSLNGSPIFLDMHLPAGLAGVFLLVLRGWNAMRYAYWCTPPLEAQGYALWTLERREPWLEGALGRLIDVLEVHAPSCRIVVSDANVTWPASLRWPELARYAAIVGPQDVLQQVQSRMQAPLGKIADYSTAIVPVPDALDRKAWAHTVFMAWASMRKQDTTPS
jgi:CHASE2 domain-containing sensor protein